MRVLTAVQPEPSDQVDRAAFWSQIMISCSSEHHMKAVTGTTLQVCAATSWIVTCGFKYSGNKGFHARTSSQQLACWYSYQQTAHQLCIKFQANFWCVLYAAGCSVCCSYTLEAGGVTWAYRKSSPAAGKADPNNRQVLLLHGLGSSSWSYR